MFLIAGISPKVVTLDPKPQICPDCGLARLYTKRVDHWLSLFFIPILKVKTGEPFTICEVCNRDTPIYPSESGPESIRSHCRFCGKRLQPEFNYCPYCGTRL